MHSCGGPSLPPCSPMRMKGTRRRPNPERAAVVTNAYVYGISGQLGPPLSTYEDQTAVVTPMPTGTDRRVAVWRSEAPMEWWYRGSSDKT